MQSCEQLIKDVPGIYPKLFLGSQLVALAISGATSHENDGNLLITAHVLLCVLLTVQAYILQKEMWSSDAYTPLNVSCCLLYGIIIGEHKQAHVAEFFFTLVSLTLFLLCFVGVARRIDLQNTIASSENMIAIDGETDLESQNTACS